MGDSELENKLRDNHISRCSSNVPFNKNASSEESYFIFHKKHTKEPEINCKIVPETHCIWYEFYSTDNGGKYYEYGEKGIKTKEPTIGGYESDFF